MFIELGCLVLHIPGDLANLVPAIYKTTFPSLCQSPEPPENIPTGSPKVAAGTANPKNLAHRESILKLQQSTYYFYENYSLPLPLESFFSTQEKNRIKTFTTKGFHSDS